ncbi:MAG TPA: leucine/isoleucine/valine transporter permease subunit, partial [Anaerolineae bacterium]|nr:leucine/isoleucine/valine transporter permease subunit [Anaerolineae bacterium]
MFSELIILVVRPLLGRGFLTLFFRQRALTVVAAILIFIFVVVISLLWQARKADIRIRYQNLGVVKLKNIRRVNISVGIIFLMFLPWILGTYLSEVIDNVGLYILMGLGLNVAVGLAGLLDLGYVTNFAVGAYIAGVLTTTGALGGAELSFWLVVPIAILAAMFTGFMLALPVLRMRGDYLAIATLGFGEIIRILALSDWLAPLIGGPQGILDIPKPSIFGFVFAGPQEFYYIILAACLVALFVFIRLNTSRTGR